MLGKNGHIVAGHTKLSRKCIVTLAVGITFGFSFAYVLLNVVAWEKADVFRASLWRLMPPDRYSMHDPHSHEDLEGAKGPDHPVIFHGTGEDFHKGEALLAEQLAKKVRVLCWVMTGPSNHQSKARHVKATWGRRCNVLLFMSSIYDPELPTVALEAEEGRDYLWAKTKLAFTHIYKHYLDEADWFMKADDDTYVVVENLRYMLLSHNASDPVYFGCRFKPFVNQGYMSGGAGYILSKEAVKRFVGESIPNKDICRQEHDGSEDVEIGKCLEAVGVRAGDSRDSLGRGRFFPFVPEHHLIPGHVPKDSWYWQYIYYPSAEGMDCCSDTAVSFHYVHPNMMYVLEYLIYHLRPYGIQSQLQKELPPSDKAERHTTESETTQEDNDIHENQSQNLPLSGSETPQPRSETVPSQPSSLLAQSETFPNQRETDQNHFSEINRSQNELNSDEQSSPLSNYIEQDQVQSTSKLFRQTSEINSSQRVNNDQLKTGQVIRNQSTFDFASLTDN